MDSPQGPNVRRLLCHFIAIEAIPSGCKNGLASGIAFLVGSKSKASADAMRRAREQCASALAMVKRARGNPFGNDEEAIASEILRRVDERNAKLRSAPTKKVGE